MREPSDFLVNARSADDIYELTLSEQHHGEERSEKQSRTSTRLMALLCSQ
jgi:hypothetical protein